MHNSPYLLRTQVWRRLESLEAARIQESGQFVPVSQLEKTEQVSHTQVAVRSRKLNN